MIGARPRSTGDPARHPPVPAVTANPSLAREIASSPSIISTTRVPSACIRALAISANPAYGPPPGLRAPNHRMHPASVDPDPVARSRKLDFQRAAGAAPTDGGAATVTPGGGTSSSGTKKSDIKGAEGSTR